MAAKGRPAIPWTKADLRRRVHPLLRLHVDMQRHPGTGKYEALLARCRRLDPVPTAIAHPCDAAALTGAVDAGARGLILPILVGPAARIRAIADANGRRSRTTRSTTSGAPARASSRCSTR